MKTIKILGTGCANCKRTEAVINTVINELGLKDVKVEKVENIQDIMAYDVMSTPAVVIDEKVAIKGRVPSFDEMKTILKEDASCCEPSDNSDSCFGSDSNSTGCC